MTAKPALRRIQIRISFPDDALSDVEEIITYPEGHEFGYDPQFLAFFLATLFHLVVAKGVSYKNSWCRRGEIRGIVSNIDRKDDRLNAAIEMGGENSVRDKLEGGVDGALYRLMYACWLRKEYPEIFDEWLRNDVKAYITRAEEMLASHNG